MKRTTNIAVLLLCLATSRLALAQDPPSPTPGDSRKSEEPRMPEAANAAPNNSGSASGAATGSANPEDDDSLFNCRKAKGKFKINFKPETELKDLVTWAFTFTCKNFIYDSKISSRASKVTLMAPDEVSAGEAWKIFLVALQSMGLTIVPKGTVLEIVDHGTAKSSPLPLFMKAMPQNSDQMVRALLRPEHLPVDELVKVLTELKSKNGDVKSIPKAGAVLITDFGTHVAKMASLMLAVDQPSGNERLYLIRIYNGEATEMATKLEEILGLKGQDPNAGNNVGPSARSRTRDRNVTVTAPGGAPDEGDSGSESAVPSKIVADERTNSLILLGGEAAYTRILALVRRLDVAIGPEGEGRVHVHRLEYASAEELAETLSSIITGTQQPTAADRRARRTPNAPGQPPVQAQGGGGGAIGADAFEGQVRVTHDTPTNSLVIIASIGDFRSLKDVIKKLDTPRPQVYIEASIIEVLLSDGLQIGTSFHAGKQVNVPGSADDALALGGFLPGRGPSSLQPTSLAASTGLVGGIIGPLLDGAVNELLGTSIPSFGVLFQALSTKNNTNVLSTPHILTTDNKEAEIVVGRNIPYKSQLAGLGGLGNLGGAGGAAAGSAAGLGLLGQSIQRQDIDLNLKLTPHISSEDAVKLDIELTIKDLGETNFEGLGPVWTNKSIKDSVVVADQQSVVLGGLVADKMRVDETKIPLLGDIPLLGYLFKYKSKTKEKTTLLVLLTPYIVRDQADLERIVKRRVREQREFMDTVASFSNIKYRPELDYRRKRGMVEEIRKVSGVVAEEKALLEAQANDQIDLPDGPIEYTPGSKVQVPPPPPETPIIPNPNAPTPKAPEESGDGE